MTQTDPRIAIAPVRKTVHVPASATVAFDVFTSGLSRWWPPQHGIARKPQKDMRLEPGVGGRWLELSADGTETRVATVTRWEPPGRLALSWQVNAQWQADAVVHSEVDVSFIEEAPDRTRVELLHHRFELLGQEAGDSMRRDVDGGWPGLLKRYARVVAGLTPEES